MRRAEGFAWWAFAAVLAGDVALHYASPADVLAATLTSSALAAVVYCTRAVFGVS